MKKQPLVWLSFVFTWAAGIACSGVPSVNSGSGGAYPGGSSGLGGATTGGIFGTGGKSTGGAPTSTGGTAATGGAPTSTGGTAATGGAPTSTGGTAATGGASATGGSTTGSALNYSWDFVTDIEGWQASFADYPPNSGTGYDLQFGWAALPPEVGSQGGLRINGNNHSDDLFMFIEREITGLTPQTTYLVNVTAIIDTNAPADCGGIGGSPGTSVYFKMGACASQPVAVLDNQGYLRMTIDKGNQAGGGTDMKVVGNIGNSLPCTGGSGPYQSKTLSLNDFTVKSAADGTLWIILGTDSGFEGITTLYYDHVAVTLKRSP